MFFNLFQTAIFQVVRWEKYFRIVRFFKKSFASLFLITFLLFLFSTSFESLIEIYYTSLGFSIIFLTGMVVCWEKSLFFNLKLKKPRLEMTVREALANPERINLAEFLSFEAAKSIWQAIKFSRRKKLPQISSEALLYFSLEAKPEIDFLFSRGLLDLKEIKKQLKSYLDKQSGKGPAREFSPGSQEVILEATKIAEKRKRGHIRTEDIIVAQSKIDPIFKNHLIKAGLKSQDIENLTFWLESLQDSIEERKKFWSQRNLARRTGLAKEWAAGYTLTLDKFSIDRTETIKQKGFEDIIGHSAEINALERILDRSEINNVLLVGEPGAGRGSVFQGLAQRILFGESLPSLNYKRVVELDMASLISQIVGPEETEMILDKVFQETIKAGNIILVIDDFHNYISQAQKPGVTDISVILLNYLHLPQFQIIAITTPAGLHKYIEQNPSVLSLFEKVEVSEISPQQTIIVLENWALRLERKYKKFVSYQALRDIVHYGERYMPAIPFPKKGFDLLDEVLVYVSQFTRDKVVLPKHVAKIVSEKTQIPVGEIEAKEKEVLLNLENLIHQRIVNQDEAVVEVATALRRARAEVTIRKGPIGCFLFLGPTGVGKTETSKALAEAYFGSESRMIRLDMSEFQHPEDVPRLIGSPGQEGLLTTQVQENPFSLILLDELEKAHPNILNLFLQVLDEGHLTDGLGRKVDFKNSIIIATSNAGYQIILQAIRQKTEWSRVKSKLLDYLFEKGIYRPEFINRFDAMVVFRPLSKENLLEIAGLLLGKLKENLAKKDIEFVIAEPLKEKIVELSYSPVFGAREMRRVIQDKVENVLAEAILQGELKKGDRVKVDSENFELIIG